MLLRRLYPCQKNQWLLCFSCASTQQRRRRTWHTGFGCCRGRCGKLIVLHRCDELFWLGCCTSALVPWSSSRCGAWFALLVGGLLGFWRSALAWSLPTG